MASCSSTRPPGRGAAAIRSAIRCRARCMSRRWIGRPCRPAQPADPSVQATTSYGNGLMRPLEAAARKAGVEFLLEHRMTAIYREAPNARAVSLGIAVDHNGRRSNIRARKAVVIGTGGSTGNVNFRRMFDPAPDRGILRARRHAVVEPGCQRRDRRDGDRRLAVGAVQPDREIGSTPDQARPDRLPIRITAISHWMPGSRVFDQARATGLTVADWQNVILVNMLGKRFYDETGGQYTANNYNADRSLRSRQLAQRQELSSSSPTISSTRRWPGSATARTAAARSGRSSMPTRSSARRWDPEPP